MSKSPCVIVEMRLDSWETFVLTHHFFESCSGSLVQLVRERRNLHQQWWFTQKWRGPRPRWSATWLQWGICEKISLLEEFLDTRPASQFDMGNGSFWMFLVSMLHAFNCFHVYQPSSGTTASERGPVVNHPEAETPAGTWETLEGSSALILVCSSRRESGPWSMVRVESCGNPVFILQTCSNCARRPDQRQTLWRQLLWHEWGECGGHWRLGKAVGGDASNCFKYINRLSTCLGTWDLPPVFLCK